MRISWLDTVRGICMLCVAMSHCGYNDSIIGACYISWFLPCFFVISGFLFKGESVSIIDLGHKLLKNLIIPYFLLGLTAILLTQDVWRGLIHGDSSALHMWFKSMFQGWVLWFLPCLLVTQVLFYVIVRLAKTEIRIVVYSLFISILALSLIDIFHILLPFHIDTGALCILFFCIGYIMRRRPSILKEIQSKIIIIIFLCIYIIGIAVWTNFFDYPVFTILAENKLGDIFAYLLMSISGSLIVISLCSRFNINNRFFSEVGKNSLFYYAFAYKTTKLTAIAILYCFPSLDAFLNSYHLVGVYGIFISLLGVALCIYPSILQQRFFPIMTGNKK